MIDINVINQINQEYLNELQNETNSETIKEPEKIFKIDDVNARIEERKQKLISMTGSLDTPFLLAQQKREELKEEIAQVTKNQTQYTVGNFNSSANTTNYNQNSYNIYQNNTQQYSNSGYYNYWSGRVIQQEDKTKAQTKKILNEAYNLAAQELKNKNQNIFMNNWDIFKLHEMNLQKNKKPVQKIANKINDNFIFDILKYSVLEGAAQLCLSAIQILLKKGEKKNE